MKTLLTLISLRIVSCIFLLLFGVALADDSPPHHPLPKVIREREGQNGWLDFLTVQ